MTGRCVGRYIGYQRVRQYMLPAAAPQEESSPLEARMDIARTVPVEANPASGFALRDTINRQDKLRLVKKEIRNLKYRLTLGSPLVLLGMRL